VKYMMHLKPVPDVAIAPKGTVSQRKQRIEKRRNPMLAISGFNEGELEQLERKSTQH
jgi:hypothetical protein